MDVDEDVFEVLVNHFWRVDAVDEAGRRLGRRMHVAAVDRVDFGRDHSHERVDEANGDLETREGVSSASLAADASSRETHRLDSLLEVVQELL